MTESLQIAGSVPEWLRDSDADLLSESQIAQLDAIFARIWPADHARQIPGAVEAKASRFVSRLLARSADTYWEIPSWAKLYPLALAALDQYAQQKYRQPLTALSDEQMIAILGGLEAGNLAEFPASADGTTLDQAVLFKTFRRHCIQGCLSAPRWGGNDQGSVWKALGYLQPATDLYPHQ